MPCAFGILFSLPGFVLCMLAYGEVDVAAENEELEGLRRLAEQDDAEGQFNLGVMYARGRGVPEDYVRAYAWCNLAAEKGYERAAKARDSLRERMTAKQIARAQEFSNAFFHGVGDEADLQTD